MAEVTEDLNKAQKRELKWERKQAKVKAAAEAAGQTYVALPKEAKDNSTDKMGKRKKRKLAALQLDSGADAQAPSSVQQTDVKSKKSKQQPGVLANGSIVALAESAADQSKAEKKAAKKVRKASLAVANGTTATEPAAAAPGGAAVQPKKQKNKSAIETSADAQSSGSQPASASSKKQKKAAASATPTSGPHGRVRAHQEVVLASVGDQELAKSGKTIQKDLYQEHPSVTGMSEEEVTKHRADRDTAVTGVDLRPVLQFDQAGSDLFIIFIILLSVSRTVHCFFWLPEKLSLLALCHRLVVNTPSPKLWLKMLSHVHCCMTSKHRLGPLPLSQELGVVVVACMQSTAASIAVYCPSCSQYSTSNLYHVCLISLEAKPLSFWYESSFRL